MSLSLIWPFTEGEGWISYKDNQKSEAVKQNLRVLLLTNPGEYTFDLDFGVGLKRLLFQQVDSIGRPIEKLTSIESDGRVQTELQPSAVSRIQSQAAKYMPYINISNISIDKSQADSNVIGIRIVYSISINNYETSNLLSEVLEFLISGS